MNKKPLRPGKPTGEALVDKLCGWLKRCILYDDLTLKAWIQCIFTEPPSQDEVHLWDFLQHLAEVNAKDKEKLLRALNINLRTADLILEWIFRGMDKSEMLQEAMELKIWTNHYAMNEDIE